MCFCVHSASDDENETPLPVARKVMYDDEDDDNRYTFLSPLSPLSLIVIDI
jgi:hypothetical protein